MTTARRLALGLDGCRRGWVGVLIDLDRAAPPLARFYPRFQAALDEPSRPLAIAVDMPIGFLDVAEPGGRACERLARQRLGPRRSSVFSAPARGALAHPKSYRAALAANRAASGAGGAPGSAGAGGAGLSLQSFHLIPKMAEVDAALTPARQGQVRESHPELAFAVLNGGRPMGFNKKTPIGRVERIGVLERAGRDYGLERTFLDPRRHEGLKGGGVARDDLVDAAALALSAARILAGDAETLPPDPPRDSRGLRMEIVA